jgi:MFS superfamily sulfate permease-like transporter
MYIYVRMNSYMLLNVGVTMVTMFAVPYTCKQIPGALAGVIMSCVIEWGVVRPFLGGKTTTVRVRDCESD